MISFVSFYYNILTNRHDQTVFYIMFPLYSLAGYACM